jgi:quercetin 2,3-dioxygenase
MGTAGENTNRFWPGTLLTPREVKLTPRSTTVVRRTIPHRDVRMIGAWCFVDHYGPDSTSENPMRVAPHPHTGLQTVTWLFEGAVEHRDSVGSVQVISPGELNIMTAGNGISHSELSIDERSPSMHGVQLWVALPDEFRHQPPHFEHHSDLPRMQVDGASVRVLIGTLLGLTSVATTYSPITAAEISLPQSGSCSIDINPEHEYGVMVTDGDVTVEGTHTERGSLLHMKPGRNRLNMSTSGPARALLLGGEPFTEQIVMWWNFIGRDHDEIVSMRISWESQDGRFGSFTGYPGERIPAPPMPGVRLSPRGAVRTHGRAPDEAEAFS